MERLRGREYRMRRYGLTQQEFLELVDAQGGLCRLCDRHCGAELIVDHDHETEDVRGLLCMQCNTGLGLLGDTPERLHKAWQYVVRLRKAA